MYLVVHHWDGECRAHIRRVQTSAGSDVEVVGPLLGQSSPSKGGATISYQAHPDLLAHLLDTQRPQIVVDSWRDERFAASDSAGTRAWMAVPVLCLGEVSAVVILE